MPPVIVQHFMHITYDLNGNCWYDWWSSKSLHLELFTWWKVKVHSMWHLIEDADGNNHSTYEPFKISCWVWMLQKHQTTTTNPAVKKQREQDNIASFSGFKQTIMGGNSLWACMMTEKVALFIIKGMNSCNIVEEPALRSLWSCLVPECLVPAYTTCSRSIKSGMLETAIEHVERELRLISEDSQWCNI